MIKSILDNDLYKFSMQQAVLELFPDAVVSYKFINRDPSMIIGNKCFEKIKEAVFKMADLQLTDDEYDFMSNLGFFKPAYLAYLKTYKFNPNEVDIKLRAGYILYITITGTWHSTILWEVVLMAIISEVYFSEVDTDWSADAKGDADILHENLGINSYNVPILYEEELKRMNNSLGLHSIKYNPVADENIQARMRGNIIMHFANAMNAIALTTGNKTELALGYCTLYGDMNGGYNPIGDLYKGQVYDLAKYLNVKFYKQEIIPKSVFDKSPSAQLAPDQTDEKSLMPYDILDCIVKEYIENHIYSWEHFLQEYCKSSHCGESLRVKKDLDKFQSKYYDMIHRIDRMEFKRRQATICSRLTKRAFGIGRRLPIVKG